MTKGTKLSEFEKDEITALKRVIKSGKFQRPEDAVKALSAITWKVQIMEKENRLADEKNYHHNSREELFTK